MCYLSPSQQGAILSYSACEGSGENQTRAAASLLCLLSPSPLAHPTRPPRAVAHLVGSDYAKVPADLGAGTALDINHQTFSPLSSACARPFL